MKPLKIGITCYPTFGGSGVVATEIGIALAALGHKVHFICYDVPKRLERFTENIYYHEVEVRDYPLFAYTPYSLALTSKMVEVATYEELDILHVHYAVPHAASAYMAKQILGSKKIKVITTLHGTDITLVGTDRSYLPITRFAIEQSDGITTPSEFLKHATYGKLNVSTSKEIEVIPNFVDTKRFFPLAQEERCKLENLFKPCNANGKIITHVSNFRPVKRLCDVVKVFAELNKEIPSHLVLVGDGPERSSIERLVRDMELQERVCFLGKQETFIKVLQNSDLFLLPSENESFGLAALEAMSCGVPVIASNVEGLPEVVKDGEVGFLSDVRDVEDMAKNAIKILSDNELHQTLSNAARSRVLELYCREKLIGSYESYYEQVIK